MENKEFNLSKFIFEDNDNLMVVEQENIKEFIKRLKEGLKEGTQKAEICKCCWEEIQNKIIDKLAGDKFA